MTSEKDDIPYIFGIWAKKQNKTDDIPYDVREGCALRPDVPAEGPGKEVLMNGATHADGDFFTAPRVSGMGEMQ